MMKIPDELPPVHPDVVARRKATQEALERGELSEEEGLEALQRLIDEERSRHGITP